MLTVSTGMLFPVSPQNADEAARLLASALGGDDEQRGRRAEGLAARGHTWALRDSTGRLVAAAAVHPSDDGRRWALDAIAVAPDRRGAGCGAQLIACLAEVLPGVHVLEAETDASGVGFYERCGFSVMSLGELYPGVVRFRCVRSLRPKTDHRGVYGIWRQANGGVVAVHKSRGPYTGLLDLPGGRPEAGETPEATLLRELDEECGVRRATPISWHQATCTVPLDANGRMVRDASRTGDETTGPFRSGATTGTFVHHALIALLQDVDEVTPVVDVEDVASVESIVPEEIPTAAGITPLLRHAVALLETTGR
jgi:8-oxo-dGTP pyrophosphatase MutT (NUDIX family)/N-acetylglutamate synthase-like GNAT family acetyltransferase